MASIATVNLASDLNMNIMSMCGNCAEWRRALYVTAWVAIVLVMGRHVHPEIHWFATPIFDACVLTRACVHRTRHRAIRVMGIN